MGKEIYLSEDSASIMRSFNRTGERLISILEDVSTTQKEIAEKLAVNINAMKNLVVMGKESMKRVGGLPVSPFAPEYWGLQANPPTQTVKGNHEHRHSSKG